MLIKIYTNQNSVKIIDGITNAEIHQGEYRFETYAQLYDAISNGPGVLRANGRTPEVQSFDSCLSGNVTPAETPDSQLAAKAVKFVDYEKAGEWKRVAVQQYAYLCNDEGRTIQKIGA